ncbi:2,3-diphosphoglycerate-dependent phosphoglycerate mutase [Bacteroidales bacterium OttesenSCG-928-B11]|nr:2,3-diphosphoglycerate-dependent phosphoglycerate mutase [Bacteroidales bacterium OttesenSCG-928-E04]MDL2313158.1 2,3-diphosphoglycerate-dependent phosphoglycerate mutase [Bacteroidales bacterium OttesenSCG-928-B11]MDL2326897.1 2,3-diphosphoglycerate-dependent phosphoglycerate mutase [Bacteroidales bacterium OttesenSCG-928-A14]
MYKLVLVRHGQSEWNELNLFTGWTDVDLTERGVREAKEAGRSLKAAGFNFRYSFTSLLTRAIKTNNFILEEMGLLWIPDEKRWQLNEKHYGNLQGMNKTEMVEKFGADQVQLWRRSYDVRPPAIPEDDPRHPNHDPRYQGIEDEAAHPGTEALLDTVNRIVPLWQNDITAKLKEYKEVLVTAHGNSLRGIIKYLKNISDQDIISLNLPTGIPYIFELDENFNVLKDYFLADEETLKKLMDEVANQTKK